MNFERVAADQPSGLLALEPAGIGWFIIANRHCRRRALKQTGRQADKTGAQPVILIGRHVPSLPFAHPAQISCLIEATEIGYAGLLQFCRNQQSAKTGPYNDDIDLSFNRVPRRRLRGMGISLIMRKLASSRLITPESREMQALVPFGQISALQFCCSGSVNPCSHVGDFIAPFCNSLLRRTFRAAAHRPVIARATR